MISYILWFHFYSTIIVHTTTVISQVGISVIVFWSSVTLLLLCHVPWWCQILTFLIYPCFILTCTTVSLGPYFPCRENLKLIGGKSNIRPPRPELNMCLLPTMVEASKVCKHIVLSIAISLLFSLFIELL